MKKKVPEIRTGYTVRVHIKIKEGEKQRIQVFEGLVIKLNSGHGADATMTVRKVIGGIGVEKIFPIYSTSIEKIEVKKTSKIRRAKLYYMRSRFGKSARLKETLVSSKEMEAAAAELADQVAAEEAAKAAEEAQAAPETAEETATTETPETQEAPAEEVATEEAPKEEAAAETTEEAPAAEEKAEEKAEEAPKEEDKKEEAAE